MSNRLNDFVDITSEVGEIPAEDKLVDTIRSYAVVLQHTIDGVEVLYAPDYEGLPDDLLELRAFDQSGELHLVQVGNSLCGRVRTDGIGSTCTVFDEEHLVWGSTASWEGDYLVLSEDRGTRVRIPLEVVVGLTPGEKRRLTIGVRNYLDESGEDAESGDTRFAFCDYRLMGFCVREVE